jgi:Cys-rich repeat protein
MVHRPLSVRRWPGLLVVTVTAASCGSSDHVLGSRSTLVDGGLDVLQGDDGGGAFVQVDAASAQDGGGSGGESNSDGNVAPADSSAQCGVCPQGQHCDATLGCVTCTKDSQCPASTRFCVQGSCVQCKTNTDCGGTTPSCWPGDQMCHAACTSNQQCAQDGNARICNASTGACVGCNSAADCPTSQSLCDATTQQCVQCSTSADCGGTSTPACLRNRCVQCATSGDCPSGMPYCAIGGDSPGRCVQCLQSAQCPPSAPSCNSGTCGKYGG